MTVVSDRVYLDVSSLQAILRASRVDPSDRLVVLCRCPPDPGGENILVVLSEEVLPLGGPPPLAGVTNSDRLMTTL